MTVVIAVIYRFAHTSSEPRCGFAYVGNPHRWLSSGLHASLTTFGAGDRQGNSVDADATWEDPEESSQKNARNMEVCESCLPYLLGYVWGVDPKNKMTMRTDTYCKVFVIFYKEELSK